MEIGFILLGLGIVGVLLYKKLRSQTKEVPPADVPPVPPIRGGGSRKEPKNRIDMQ